MSSHLICEKFVLKAFVFVHCVPPVVKRLPEHVQVDNPEVLKKLAKKLERQQVGTRFCQAAPKNTPMYIESLDRYPKHVASKRLPSAG